MKILKCDEHDSRKSEFENRNFEKLRSLQNFGVCKNGNQKAECTLGGAKRILTFELPNGYDKIGRLVSQTQDARQIFDSGAVFFSGNYRK